MAAAATKATQQVKTGWRGDFEFVQLSDPQFGYRASLSGLSEHAIEEYARLGIALKPSAKVKGFTYESSRYERAIERVNQINPDFIIVTGDMVTDPNNPAQAAELWRITKQLNPDIRTYWVPGNHDVGNSPTFQSLQSYRERFGTDYYAFDHKGCHFVVMNSAVCFDPGNVEQEWDDQLRFLRATLGHATRSGSRRTLVFTHHPLFLREPDEEDSWAVVPSERRRVLLDLFKENGVSTVFSGHWHRNGHAMDENLEMITTGPVGFPLGDDPSGFRIVRIGNNSIEHEYISLETG